MAKLGHEIEYLLAAGGGALARRLSPQAADRFAVGLGNLVHAVWKKRRTVAYENLSKALGNELPDPLIRDIVKRVFQNMARSLVEVSRFPAVGRERARAMIEGAGIEHVEEARRRGKGCIVITAHFGNWELFGNWISLMGHPIDLLVGVQHNQKIHRLFNGYRHSLGAETIEATVAARGIMRSLKQNRVVGIAGDQHSHTGLPLEFFGRTAVATRGPALFAVKADAPLLPYLMRRERYDRHVVMAGDPIYPPHSGDVDRDVDNMTIAVHRFYETVIRRYPDQWMWTHRRWKAAEAREKGSNFSATEPVEEP